MSTEWQCLIHWKDASDISKMAETKKSGETKHPLYGRYPSKEMKAIFGDERKFTGWRDCWIALAECERELGVDQIKSEYIETLKRFRNDIPYERAAELETKLKHDVMAHIKAYQEQVDPVCPGAGGIIHYGATSMFPCDNTELGQMKDGLDLVIGKTVNVFRRMKPFAEEYMDAACLGRTHFQNAQPTTYGKRICDWTYNFVLSLENVVNERRKIKGLGVKGTTGTQDSFMKIFNGDVEKIVKLDEMVCKKLGFNGSYKITTQTYPRIVDYQILSAISGLAVAAKKMCTDLRLLQGLGELSEPFGKEQIGSSAMAYKRNPMKAERVCGLSRHVFSGSHEAAEYGSEQWLERTLDDSAERRIVIADTFLGIDSILNLTLDIFSHDSEKQYGFRVYRKKALANLMKEMPFMITEEVIDRGVKAGGDRQEIHEIIRQCSMRARENIDEGGEGDMFGLMAARPELGISLFQKENLMKPMNYVGSVDSQCKRFFEETLNPILESYLHIPNMQGGVKV